ncbi:MAG TPA: flagellar biosynthetic protein FliO [Firmicutes bacterium]|nr:flagellar biosynthetic protein FliO [Bacillota bacterium]
MEGWQTSLRLFLALLLVAPLAYWGARLYARLQHPWATGGVGGMVRTRGRRHLEVLDALALGGGKIVWLIRAGETRLVLASADRDLRLLARLGEGRSNAGGTNGTDTTGGFEDEFEDEKEGQAPRVTLW